jgi:hypothetical protein
MTRICFLSFILILAASPAAVAQYYEYDPDDPEQQAPLREGEKALIPLDTADPAYNLWQTPRDDLSEGREPGPIDIQRFIGGAGWFGIPTFFRLPVALTPEDLMAGDVDVAIVGGYTDMGGGGRGAAWGPMAFRASPSTVGWGAFAMDHMLTLVNPFEEMTVVDYGDAPKPRRREGHPGHHRRRPFLDVSRCCRSRRVSATTLWPRWRNGAGVRSWRTSSAKPTTDRNTSSSPSTSMSWIRPTHRPVLDPAYTPATGTPEPNGLTPREVFPLIRRLCAESNVVGFELVELLPYRVPGYETVLNSERIVRECLVGIAMRKKGIDEKWFLDPRTASDGRD